MQEVIDSLRASLRNPERRDLSDILVGSIPAATFPSVGWLIEVTANDRLNLLETGIKMLALATLDLGGSDD